MVRRSAASDFTKVLVTGDGNVHYSAECSPVSAVLLGFTLPATLQLSMTCDVVFLGTLALN